MSNVIKFPKIERSTTSKKVVGGSIVKFPQRKKTLTQRIMNSKEIFQ